METERTRSVEERDRDLGNEMNVAGGNAKDVKASIAEGGRRRWVSIDGFVVSIQMVFAGGGGGQTDGVHDGGGGWWRQAAVEVDGEIGFGEMQLTVQKMK